MASASLIFKIRATADNFTRDPEQVSFRKGQPFYALSHCQHSQTYFVSTQFAVPFARTAVCGKVPANLFEVVPLMGKEPRTKPNIKQHPHVDRIRTYPTTKTPEISKECNRIKQISLAYVGQVISNHDTNVYQIEVIRLDQKHRVRRTAIELEKLHQSLQSLIPNEILEIPSFYSNSSYNPALMLTSYFNHMILKMNTFPPEVTSLLNSILTPRNLSECIMSKHSRRDSGHNEPDTYTSIKKEQEMRRHSHSIGTANNILERKLSRLNSLAKFTNMVFRPSR